MGVRDGKGRSLSGVNEFIISVCAPSFSRLNEGHTVYLERMIGRSMESEQFRQFKAMGGWKELQESVREHTHMHEYTVTMVHTGVHF